MRHFIRATFLMLACGHSAALAQCEILLQETFRFGPRQHGGNGQLREPDLGDGLAGYWPQLPAAAIWEAQEQGWLFAAASLDPLEVDPLDPFNGVAFVNADLNTAALLPFTPPTSRYTLSLEIAMGQLVSPAIHIGYSASSALTDNFQASGVLWLAVDAFGAWQLFANGSTFIASGQGDYTHSLESGWLPIELSYDPALSQASGTIGGNHFGPIAVSLTAPVFRVGFEARGNFFNAVNNMRIVRGTPLSVSVQGPVLSGAAATFTATTNAADPSGIAWRHNGSTLANGPTAWGSIIAGASTGSLTITNISASDTGTYDAIVFNACGSLTSPPVALSLCYPNCDGSTSAPMLTANDFQCFLNSFASGAPYANCDQSTTSPVLTANDFQCFLNLFAAGCN